MGFWDEVVRVTGAVAGETGSVPAPVAPAMSASLVREAVAMLAGGGADGLAGLVQRVERQGLRQGIGSGVGVVLVGLVRRSDRGVLGWLIGSCVGRGETLPISGQQLRAVLGEPRLAE